MDMGLKGGLMFEKFQFTIGQMSLVDYWLKSLVQVKKNEGILLLMRCSISQSRVKNKELWINYEPMRRFFQFFFFFFKPYIKIT